MSQDLYYSSTAVQMSLTGGIGSSDTSCVLSSTSGLPVSFPFKLLIDWGSSTQEVVHVTAVSGTTATIVRGQDGTSAQTHAVGAVVVHGVSAYEFNTASDHRSETSGVHGVTGSLVGTTNTQTLTNKTLTQPAISTITPDGTHVLTLQNTTDTLVGRATTDTLTNKTLTSPVINGATIDATTTIDGVLASTLIAPQATAPKSGSLTGVSGPSGGTLLSLSLTVGTWLVNVSANASADHTVGTSSPGQVRFTATPPSGITISGSTTTEFSAFGGGSISPAVASGLNLSFIATVTSPGSITIATDFISPGVGVSGGYTAIRIS